MAHHWRASDSVVRVGAGEWKLWDRGRLVGWIQYGRRGGKPAFRGVIKQDDLVQVIGYAADLEEACTRLWNWDVQFAGAHRDTVRAMETLGSIGEAAALQRIFPRLPSADAQLLGPGDDAAIVATPDGRVVITTDMMIHGPDFRLAWSTPHDLGWKAAASNLADVAAMGAVPTALVVALAAPADTPVAFLEQFADGLRDGCEAMAPGCGVVGGDLSVTATLTIAVTAFGDLEGRRAVLRSGARAGDVVAVSGVLGAAAEGLRLLFDLGTPDAATAAALKLAHPAAVSAQLAPTPPIADGRAAALGGATAMLDLSDGLAIDARRIATASGVALDLHVTRAELEGGEDHSLLATFPAGTALPGGFRPIGSVVEGAGVLLDGVPYDQLGGWDPYSGWDGNAG